MQVAPDTSPLLLAQLDDVLPRQLELLREPDRVDRCGNLRCEVDDQTVVALTEALARPRCEPELADGGPWWTSGKARMSAPGVPYSAPSSLPVDVVPASTTPTYCSASVWPSVSTTVGSTASRLQRARECPAEPGDRGVGIVTLAVHQPIDEPLHTRTQGLEADCDDAGHDERDDEVAAG